MLLYLPIEFRTITNDRIRVQGILIISNREKTDHYIDEEFG